MASAAHRWKLIDDLDDWLRWPMIGLSVAWLAIVLYELVAGSSALLETLGTAIWVVFILEFLLRFALAPAKLTFLKSNWLTLFVLAVPALRILRVFRVLRAARALRGLRLVRIVGTANRSMRALKRTLRRRRFGYVLALTSLVVALGAGGMLSFEPASETPGGFTGYWHALWWTGMLVTSIGSDYWPHSSEGRILALLLSIYGLGVLGYMTATFASFFVGRDAEEPGGPVAGHHDLVGLREEIVALRRLIEQGRSEPS